MVIGFNLDVRLDVQDTFVNGKTYHQDEIRGMKFKEERRRHETSWNEK